MKMDLPMMGVLFLLICVVIGRMMLVKARRKIPAEQQQQLFQAFAKVRIYTVTPIAILLVSFIVFTQYVVMTTGDLVGFMGVLALITAGSQVYIFKKFAASDLPRDYLRAQTISSALTLLGVIVYIATVAISGIPMQ